jgi:hypothetical protein
MNQIVRLADDREAIHTLFLIGNGAIENGDEPLKRAIERAGFAGYFNHNSSLIDNITSLTILHDEIRSMLDMLILYASDDSLKSIAINDAFSLCVKNILARLHFRTILADEYKNYFGLKIRESVLDELEKNHSYSSRSYFVTTNWDSVLFGHTKIKNVIQLHGSCFHPSTLILPMETVRERAVLYRTLKLFEARIRELASTEGIPQSQIDLIYDHYKLEGESIAVSLFEAEKNLRDYIKLARKIVVAGLALNSYDSELKTILANSTVSEDLQEVVIINTPDPYKTLSDSGRKKAVEDMYNKVIGILNPKQPVFVRYVDSGKYEKKKQFNNTPSQQTESHQQT